MSQLLRSIRKRLPVLVLFLAIVTACFYRAIDSGSALGAVPWLLIGVALIVLSALLVAWPLAEFLSIPFQRIYFPHVEDKPAPAYQLAEWYLQQLRFEEALQEYHKIVRYHPRELVARCIEIELLVAKFGEYSRARRSFRRGMRMAREQNDRAQLTNAYQNALAKAAEEAGESPD